MTASHDATVIVNGHKNDFDNAPVDGVLSGTCRICGKRSQYAVPTSMSLWWRNQKQIDDNAYYWSVIDTEMKSGEKAECWIQWECSSDLPDRLEEFDIVSSDEGVLHVVKKNSSMSYLQSGSKKGKAIVTIKARYNPDLRREITFYVNCLSDSSV